MKNRQVEPLHDRIIVERIPNGEDKIGSLYIPESAQNKAMLCKVLKVGPGVWRDGEFCKTVVRPGDVVVVPAFGGQHPDVELEDGSILIQEGDIGAVLGYAGALPHTQYRKPAYA